jgi:hypothetical protein
MRLLLRMRNAYDAHFLEAELAAAVLITLILYRIEVLQYAPKNVETIYIALTAAFGALLGFAITGISVILAFSDSEKLNVLKKSPFYPLVFSVFVSAAKVLGFGFALALVGLLVQAKSKTGMAVAYLAVFATIASAFRLYRCIWVLENIVAIVTAESR